jgi:hypothetical protein
MVGVLAYDIFRRTSEKQKGTRKTRIEKEVMKRGAEHTMMKIML